MASKAKTISANLLAQHLVIKDVSTMRTIELDEAKRKFPELLKEVERRNTVRIYRNGKPVADLTPVQLAKKDPLKTHPELKNVEFFEDPSLPLESDE